MMFAGFGQWREVWLQRGMALGRSRRVATAGTPATQGYLPSDCSLPHGMVWGADGVTEARSAQAADAASDEGTSQVAHAGRGGEPSLSPDHLRSAGAI